MRTTARPTTRPKPAAGAASAGALLGRRDAGVEFDAERRLGSQPAGEAGTQVRELGQVNWAALAPGGLYPRLGQKLVHAGLLLATLPLSAALSFPIALVNLAIFRDPRKILFKQPRVGYRGRIFTIYKFRTMTEPKGGAFGSWCSGEDAARVTSFGRLLRNAHLDELPQFLNILRGEMTFIGPRPEMIEIDAWARERIPAFHRRLALKPGITGWSQITQGYAGMSADAYAKKLAGDERYRTRISLAEDLRILARTGAWMLRGRGWRWRDGLEDDDE